MVYFSTVLASLWSSRFFESQGKSTRSFANGKRSSFTAPWVVRAWFLSKIGWISHFFPFDGNIYLTACFVLDRHKGSRVENPFEQWGFPELGVPKWMVDFMENPIEKDDD